MFVDVEYVTHDESMIKRFMADPDFADMYIQEVFIDGDEYERERTQYWYDEAKARSFEMVAQA